MKQDNRIVVPINNITKYMYCPLQIYVEYFIGVGHDNKYIVEDGYEFHGTHISKLPKELVENIYFDTLSKEEYNEKNYGVKLITKFNPKNVEEIVKGINKLKKMKHPEEKRINFFDTDEVQIIHFDGNFKCKDYENYYGRNVPVLSKKLKIIGSIDEITKIDGEWILIEKKSKHLNQIYRQQELQCNAYLYCLKELGLDINKYRVVTPNNEFYGSYDNNIISIMENIIEKIRYIIENKKIPTYDLSKCNTCNISNKCKPILDTLITKIDFKRKKIVIKKK